MSCSQIPLFASSVLGNICGESPLYVIVVFFGGKLYRSEEVQEGCYRVAHFNLGSITVNPMTVPRGIEPEVCTSVKEDQN